MIIDSLEPAYLDPGTGSVLLQALLGGLAGLAVAVKLFGRRLLASLTFWRRRSPGAAEKHSDAESA